MGFNGFGSRCEKDLTSDLWWTFSYVRAWPCELLLGLIGMSEVGTHHLIIPTIP